MTATITGMPPVWVALLLFSIFLPVRAQAQSVVAWGWDFFGQSTVPPGLSGVKAIAAASNQDLLLFTNGTVQTWGEEGSSVPNGLSNVVAIAGGGLHLLALLGNGTVVAWDDDRYGQTDVPAGLNNVVAIAGGGFFSLALKSDGTVVAWGENDYGQCEVPSNLTNVVAIAAGEEQSLALKSDGTVVAWGDLSQESLPYGLANVTAVALGWAHSLALKSDGTVVAWGDNSYGECNVPANLTNVIAIAAGGYHSLALTSNGTVVTWGTLFFGNATLPSDLSNVVAIAAGENNSLALTSNLAILGQPASPTVIYGASASLSVVTADQNVSYQWYQGQRGDKSQPLAGATSAMYVTSPLTQSTSYWVQVSNILGSLASNTSTISLQVAAPKIVPNGGQFALNSTQNVTLARSTPGSSITYTLDGTTPTLASQPYTAPFLIGQNTTLKAASFLNGLVPSPIATATFSFMLAPNIISEPPFTAVTIGNATTLIVNASGWNLKYQWYLGQTGNISNPINGATSIAYTTPPLTQPTSYWVRVSNPSGYLDSSTVNVTINPSVIFVTQPSNQAVSSGSMAIFSVNATGSASLSYQWRHNGENIPGAGAMRADLTIPFVTTSSLGNYDVIVTSAGFSYTSSPATLSFGVISKIIASPASLTLTAGPNATATFSVVVAGTPTPAIQWQTSPNSGASWTNAINRNFSGVTTANLTVSTTDGSLSGTQFRAVATNLIGNIPSTAISKIATLTVNLPAAFIGLSAGDGNHTSNSLAGSNFTVSAGTSVTFSANATGTALKYQWQLNGQPIRGATMRFYTITKTAMANSGNYTVIISNAFSSPQTSSFTLNVLTKPALVTALKATSVKPTTNPKLTVVASGNPLPTFAWTFSGNSTFPDNISYSNTTNTNTATSVLTFTNATISNTGTYKVVITNSQSPPVPLSSSAKLTVK
jgi:alpha-tubulin suppressor-like RCC1 family protein